MQTLEKHSIDAATSPPAARLTSISAVSASAAPVSAGWVIRRAALWMLIVGVGIAGSCLLYLAASQAEVDANAGAQPTNVAAKP